VACGGVLGAALRWAVLTTVPPGRFPWPVLVINVVGSFILGVVMAEEWAHPKRRVLLHDGTAIGCCGGLTTMSTFAVEVANLLGDGHGLTACAYAAGSIVGAVLAVVAGAALLHRASAVRLPLEERP
jgi:CrcB protein